MQSKHPAGRLPDPPSPIADDGDEARFCGTCAFSSACIAAGYHKPELAALQCLVEHVGPFRAIFAVRGGTVKTRMVDKDGREQVLGFYLPGEVIGLNAIYPEHFPCDAVALDTTFFCRFSFPAMSALASRIPAVQQHLFRMLSKELGTASLLAGDHSADERVAAFLMDLASRYEARGFSGTRFHLSMSRGDIANYLRLAAETVSRVLSRFRIQKLIQIEGRELQVLDPKGLRAIGQALLPE
jgi:CRP/FNR family transcriptional regulator